MTRITQARQTSNCEEDLKAADACNGHIRVWMRRGKDQTYQFPRTFPSSNFAVGFGGLIGGHFQK